LPFKRRDLRVVGENEIDFILALEQPPARGVIEGEGFLQPLRIAHLTAFEVNRQLVARAGVGPIEDGVDRRFGDGDRHQAVADRVVAEDVGKRRRDDRPEPGIGQRPGGVLA